VLIYMDNEFQHRVMQMFHYALRPGGYLFLGPSESVSRESSLFSAADKKHRILQRRDTIRASLPELQPSPGPQLAVPASVARNEDQIEKNVRRVMEKHFPAYFVIDRHPAFENVWIAGGGSGHGFKHGPAVGEYAAARVTGAMTPAAEPRFSLASKSTHQNRAVY